MGLLLAALSAETLFWTLRLPEGAAPLCQTAESQGQAGAPYGVYGCPVPVLGRGLGLRASQDVPGGQQESVWLHRPVRAQWPLLFSRPWAEVDVFSPLRISEKVLLHLLRHPSVNQEVRFDLSLIHI